MLARTVSVRKDGMATFSRALSSSSRLLAGVSIGGQPQSSSPLPSTSRPSLAALRGQVKSQSPATNQHGLPDESRSRSAKAQQDFSSSKDQQQQQQQPKDSYLPASSRSRFATLRSQVQAPKVDTPNPLNARQRLENDRGSKSNTRGQTATKDRWSALAEEVPDNSQNETRREQSGDDGWGPGLRDRIQSAQEAEQSVPQRSKQREARSPLQSLASQRTVQAQGVAAEEWEPRTAGFDRLQAEDCKVPGFEDWVIFRRKENEDSSTVHLLARRVQFHSNALAFQCIASLATYFLSKSTFPTHLSTDPTANSTLGRHEKKILQIELGGKTEMTAEKKGKSVDTDREVYAIAFQSYYGIQLRDVQSAIRINRLIETFANLDKLEEMKSEVRPEVIERKEKNLSGKVSGGGQRDLKRSTKREAIANPGGSSEANTKPRESIRALKQEGGPIEDKVPVSVVSDKPLKSPNSEGDTSKGQLDLQGGSALAGRLRAIMDSQPNSKDRSVISSLSEEPEKKNERKSGAGRYDGVADVFGEKTLGDITPIPNLSANVTRSKDGSAMTDLSNEATDRSVGGRFDGVDDVFSSSTTHDIDEATPVHVDGYQAEGVATMSGAHHPDEMTKKRKGTDEDNLQAQSLHPTSDPVDEYTPVHMDDESGRGTLDTRDAGQGGSTASIGDIVEQSSAPKRSANNFSLSSQSDEILSDHSNESADRNAGDFFEGTENLFPSSTTHEVDEATPISIDGGQEQDTTATTMGADHSIQTRKERQGTEGVAESLSLSEPSSNAVDESTPVNIDGEQAQNVTPTTGSDHPVDIAEKQEGDQIDEEEGSNIISSVVDGSASQSQSSSNHLEESVPVAVDSEQGNSKK